MREDTWTNTPEAAAAYEQLRARDADLTEPCGFVETRTPLCCECQNASRSTYVCGPCQRQIADEEYWRARERNEEWWSE